jgi:hypothetical protein
MFNSLNKFLQDSLLPCPVIILIAFFCILNTWVLWEETTNTPQVFRSVFFSVIIQNTNISTSGKQTISYLQFWQPWHCLIPTTFQNVTSNTYTNSEFGESFQYSFIFTPRDIFFVKTSQLCKWSVQYQTFWYPSSLDLCKQISSMHTNCTGVWNGWHDSIISSSYL